MSKSSNAEKFIRVRTVQEWIMKYHSYSDIIQSAINLWAVSERQAKRYYHDAFVAFQEKEKQSLESLKAYHKAQRRKLIADMDPVLRKTPSGVRATAKVLDSIALLDGVPLVKKVEITGKDGGPIQQQQMPAVDLSSLSIEQLKLLRSLKQSFKTAE